MQFLFLLDLNGAQLTSEQLELMASERAQSQSLYGAEVVRQVWSRADKPGACMIVEAADSDSAMTSIQSLPLVNCGALKATQIPLRAYSGFLPPK